MKKIWNVPKWMILSILLAYGGLVLGKIISFFGTAFLLLIYGTFGDAIFLPSYMGVITENLSFLGIILLVALVLKKTDKNKLRKQSSVKKWNLRYLSGVFICLIMIVGLLAILLITHTIKLGTEINLKPIGMLFILISFMIQAYAEEYLFRGLIQSKLEQKNGIIVSIICTNIMFALLHAMNPGISIISVLNIILFGVLLSLITWETGNVTVASGIHMGWNFCNEMVLGLPNSGLVCKDAIFASQVKKESIWFNKIHGAEGGIALTIILVCMFGIVAILRTKKPKAKKLNHVYRVIED